MYLWQSKIPTNVLPSCHRHCAPSDHLENHGSIALHVVEPANQPIASQRSTVVESLSLTVAPRRSPSQGLLLRTATCVREGMGDGPTVRDLSTMFLQVGWHPGAARSLSVTAVAQACCGTNMRREASRHAVIPGVCCDRLAERLQCR
jgi:hypothetical protein